ncbi:MAG TPA: EamA family transporter [Actinomycetota bacterium]|nr:EamA family transporter [Actinomycetota bacterium]
MTKDDQPRSASDPLIWSALAIVYVVWGSTYLAIRVLAIEHAPAFISAGVRFVIAGAVMLLVGRLRTRRAPERITPHQLRSSVIVGGALLLGGNGMVVFAEQRVDSGVAALMVASMPLWFALFLWLFHGERLPRPALVGLALGFGGIALLSWPSGTSTIATSGIVALLIAPMAWSAGSIYARRAPLPRDPFLAAGLETVAGGILLLAAAAATGEFRNLDPHLTTRAWLSLSFLIVAGSLVAFTAYMWLVRNAPTSLVSTYAYVNPVVAVLLGSLLLQEPIGVRTVTSAAIIIAGVAMMVSTQARRQSDVVELSSPADAPVPVGIDHK